MNKIIRIKKLLFVVMLPVLFSGCDFLSTVASTAGSFIPTEGEVASGLKEALVNGVSKGTSLLNVKDAFLEDAVRKILLPPEVREVEAKIRGNLILNTLIGASLDNCVTAMNRGAENAMGTAFPIFKNAVMSMTITDAMGILKGGNGSATQYLEMTTTSALHAAFKPEVQKALDAVQVMEYWEPIVTNINKYKVLLGRTEDINPDLNAYVTEKASAALFGEIRIQENAIRENPVERTTALLKKVFDYADSLKQ